jgi:hypothetical protein
MSTRHIQKEPLWAGGISFGIANYKLEGEGDIIVTCTYKTKLGELLYPYVYTMSKVRAREYREIPMGTTKGRRIPIDDFTKTKSK